MCSHLFWLPVATFLAVGKGLSVATIWAVGAPPPAARALATGSPGWLKALGLGGPGPWRARVRAASFQELWFHKQTLMIPMLAPAIRNRKKQKRVTENICALCAKVKKNAVAETLRICKS